MRIENKRVVIRRQIDKAIIEDNSKGLILTDSNLNALSNLGFEDFYLLDFAPNGNIILLKSKNWQIIRNTNKTTITAIDIETKQQLFSTDKFLGYRSLIDNSSNYFLLEYYSGLCCINIKNGEIVSKKDKIDKSLYNADLHLESNVVHIPTGKKSILRYNFSKHFFDEIKLENIGGTSWIKFNNAQTHVLISDKKNSLHCFTYDNIAEPIWTINFSKLKKDNRIWCYKIITTESNLGCIQGFTPTSDQNAYTGGTLYIFYIPTGEIIDSFDYANIQEKIITDFQNDEIIIDDLRSLSLTAKRFLQTPISSYF